MTTERAIELLKRISDSQFDGPHGDERREALEMAVRALEGDGDTISRQATIIVIENSGLDDDSKDTVVRVLEQLPSTQPHWIPCSERLPEIKENHVSDTVICYCSNGAYAFSQLQENIFGQCGFECERDDDYYEAVGDVIAWMPLPKPYRGDAK